jgi:DedD protein
VHRLKQTININWGSIKIMEKKKLLLVAVSVGIFLIIVIGLSILIFLPRNKEPVSNARAVSKGTAVNPNTAINSDSGIPSEPEQTAPATVDAVDMLRNRDMIQGLQSPPVPTIVRAEESDRSGTGRTSENNGSNLVIEVQRPSAAAVPNTDSAGRTGSNQNVAPVPSRPASSTRDTPSSVPAPSTRSPNPPVATITPASKPVSSEPSKPPAQASKTHEDYWIQVGAFSTQVKAQDLKDMLASKGITAIIENRDVNGQNFFRVRVGPYTSQNESNYWLAHIKTLGFEESQIRQSSALR